MPDLAFLTNTSFLVDFLYEMAYLLIVLGIMFFIVIAKGRQAVINIIVGLYFALLISLVFPYYDLIFNSFESSKSIAAAKLGLFAVFTVISTLLVARVMPDEFREKKFESFGKKLILSAAATVVVMVFSFQVLPVTEFLTPGTPIQSIFAPEEYFFWWLLLPLLILFLV